jgi:plasmid stabilization system protein ParE
MLLQWTSKAHSDLARLHEFLDGVSPTAAAKTVRNLVAGARRILRHPRIGPRLDEFAPREVRRLLIGDYELRYELTPQTIYVLRIFHTREDR